MMMKLQQVAGLVLVAANLAGTGCYVSTYGRAGYSPVYTSASVQTTPVVANGGAVVVAGDPNYAGGTVYANGGAGTVYTTTNTTTYGTTGGYVGGQVNWGAPPGAIVVSAPPPVAVMNNSGPMGMGAAGQVWIDGHYEWRGNNYMWMNGHWENPPQQGLVWQQPAYNGNQWYPGYWRTQNVQVPEIYINGNGRWNAGYTAGVSLGANVGGTVVNTNNVGGGATVRVNGGSVGVGVGVGVAPPVLPRKR